MGCTYNHNLIALTRRNLIEVYTCQWWSIILRTYLPFLKFKLTAQLETNVLKTPSKDLSSCEIKLYSLYSKHVLKVRTGTDIQGHPSISLWKFRDANIMNIQTLLIIKYLFTIETVYTRIVEWLTIKIREENKSK